MSKINIEANRNEDSMKLKLSKLYHRLEKINRGGGQAKIDKQHKKGKMTARERIAALTDQNSFSEYGALAGGNHPAGEAPLTA